MTSEKKLRRKPEPKVAPAKTTSSFRKAKKVFKKLENKQFQHFFPFREIKMLPLKKGTKKKFDIFSSGPRLKFEFEFESVEASFQENSPMMKS